MMEDNNNLISAGKNAGQADDFDHVIPEMPEPISEPVSSKESTITNRRSFLKKLGFLSGSVLLPFLVPEEVVADSVTEKYRERIQMALEIVKTYDAILADPNISDEKRQECLKNREEAIEMTKRYAKGLEDYIARQKHLQNVRRNANSSRRTSGRNSGCNGCSGGCSGCHRGCSGVCYGCSSGCKHSCAGCSMVCRSSASG